MPAPVRPANGSRPFPGLRLINALGRPLLNNGFSWMSLEERVLLDKVRQQAKGDDFGEESFRRPLKTLLNALKREARLNFVGRLCVHGDLLRLLQTRLRLIADRRRFPAIADEVIRRPLFITGLPRSGTTFLHALLAQDPAHRAPQVWEVMYPSPPPEKASYRTDPRIARTRRQLKAIDILMPEFRTVHLVEANLPQECIAITGPDFRSHVFETMYYVPSYRAWFDGEDKVATYEFHRQTLQHLQWRCPGSRWVLKAPSHLLSLEALLTVYPDAGIILTHRDPLKVLGSCASFTEVLRRAFSDHPHKATIGEEVRSRWEEGARLAVAARRRKNSGNLLDVLYSDLVADPMAVVRQVYRHFELELTETAEAAMRRFMAVSAQHKAGVHRYSLEEFGLDPDEERRRFQAYTDFFGIEPEV